MRSEAEEEAHEEDCPPQAAAALKLQRAYSLARLRRFARLFACLPAELRSNIVEQLRERMREEAMHREILRKRVLLRFRTPTPNLWYVGRSAVLSPLLRSEKHTSTEAAALCADFELSTRYIPYFERADAVVVLEASIVYRRRIDLLHALGASASASQVETTFRPLLESMAAFAQAAQRRFPGIRPRTNAEWARELLGHYRRMACIESEMSYPHAAP